MSLSLFPIALVTLSLLTSGAGCRPEEPDRDHGPGSRAVTDGIDWKQVDQAMGRVGKHEAGDVHRYSMPRTDLTVVVQGVKIRPALSLGSWLAFSAQTPAGSFTTSLVDSHRCRR